MRALQKFWIIIIVACLWSGLLLAGNTGKIAGVVKDKQTGEPLIGASISVKETILGASTDEDGYFFILQVPPGTYDLEASYLGYHTITIKNVKVRVDLTTEVNIEMESETIEGPTIVVQAEQARIQKDVTSTRRTTTKEELEATPGLERALDVFNLQGGTYVGSGAAQSIQLGDGTELQVRDQSVKDVHIRGGRGGEILYMVDGVPVTHPIYGGRDVLELNVSDVEEVELLTGGFNAEYGNAQSGVVNITTRSGGNKLTGGIEYRTDEFNIGDVSYEEHYASFFLGGPEPFTSNLFPQIGLDLPGELTFFMSGNADLTNTPYNNGRDRDQFSVLGLELTEKQENTGNLNTKIDWQLNNSMKINLSYHGSWLRWSDFNWLWIRNPNHMADYRRSNQNFILKFNHTLSKSTFYNVNVGFLGVDYDGSLRDMEPSDFWTFYKDGQALDYDTFKRQYSNQEPDSIESNVLEAQTDQLTGFFDNQSFETRWRDDLTKTFTLKGDITSQIHPEHLLKTGIEVQYHDIQYVDIQDGGTKLSPYGEHIFRDGPEFVRPVGPYPEFGQNRWVFDAYPWIGSWYVQDKFEKETLILNAGLRVDWFTPGSTVFDDAWQAQWEAATGLDSDWDDLRYKLSPRFGISFPISEKMKTFFSYGHFLQLPEMQFFYRDPYTGGFTGNPHLDYEQTVLYEFGFKYLLANDYTIDVKSYAKDISQQVGTTQLTAALGLPVSLYDNNGYARARGLEFELRKFPSDITSGTLTYAVQWANGFTSSAFENFIRSLNDFPNPIRERPLDWDIRHQIIFQGGLTAKENQHPKIFGLKLPDNWSLTILSRFQSGRPYTPGTDDPALRQILENANDAPYTATTDLKFRKSFNVMNFKLAFFVDIFNLINRNNVQRDFGFNNWTGEPYEFGDLSGSTNQLIDWYDAVKLMDLRQFAPERRFKLGMKIDW